jgi:hypothetical protein
MTIFGYTFAQIKKAATTGIGFAIAVLTLFIQAGFGPSNWIAYAVLLVGLLTTALTFILKNAPVVQS